MKRLLFESQTQLLAILKEQVMNPEPSVARKVPPAERETRLANLKTSLVGVLVEEHAEPSHSLLDAATQLYDQNVLRFIPLEKCYSRLTELSFTNKPQSKLLEVESSKVVIRDKDAEFESSVESSCQALEAFKRRGLALDFANVMTLTDTYMSRQIRTAPFCSPQQGAACRLQQMQLVTVASGRQSGMVFADREKHQTETGCSGCFGLERQVGRSTEVI